MNRKAYIEIKKIKGNEYAYISTNIWDEKEKKEIKKSKYLGKSKDNLIIMKDFAIPEKTFQYGDMSLIINLNRDSIKRILSDKTKYNKEIIALSLIIALYRSPLYNAKYYYKKTFISYIWPRLKLNAENMIPILRTLALNRENYEFQKSIDESVLLLHIEVGMSIPSSLNSNNMYAILDIFIDAITMDIITTKHIIDNFDSIERFIHLSEEPENSGILILEDSYYSKENIKLLKKLDKNFIIELNRNKIIDELKDELLHNKIVLKKGYNEHLKRYLFHAELHKNGLWYFLFLDHDIHAESIELKNFKNIRFAITNMDINHNLVYQAINTRRFLSLTILYSKYRLYSDRAFLKDNLSIEGYILLNSLALKFYLSLFKYHDYLVKGRMKMMENFLLELSTINIFMIKNKIYMSKINNKLINEMNPLMNGIDSSIRDYKSIIDMLK